MGIEKLFCFCDNLISALAKVRMLLEKTYGKVRIYRDASSLHQNTKQHPENSIMPGSFGEVFWEGWRYLIVFRILYSSYINEPLQLFLYFTQATDV